MRDFIVLVLVCVGVVVGVGWYLLPGSHNLFRTTIAVEAPPGDAEKPAPPPEKPHKAPAVAAHKSEKAPTVAEMVLPGSNPPPTNMSIATARTKPIVVPRPGDIALGADRARIIDYYGDPNLLASTEDRGHLFETMVYGKERRQAIIKLQDGVVSSVYAK